MDIEKLGTPVRSIFDKFSREKEVELVYGTPIEAGSRKVIPVAEASYYIGGGGGSSEGSENEPVTHGEGGGGYIKVKPMGVYEVTEEYTAFIPTYDTNKIVFLAALLTGAAVGCLAKKRK
ncbi:hypothetical protein [Halobacillus sp. A5]|uniref:hypothetical protein n=1 Tax=Halobacillus sp. A5 TaxID=2880263 RepID=UPI0020A66F50|nr:hypothetical protein [Halobacillus sp. A5]MCP3026956.1 hypothetical protein [Halobacillus sp. A5]